MRAAGLQLPAQWLALIGDQFEQPYMHALEHFLQAEQAAGKVIYPPAGQIFQALQCTLPAQVKVVILGQDPYHGPGQAHGLCFSVAPGVKPPPSLVNIFKELQRDLQLPVPRHGCLQAWAEQGVLLLNTVLTVEQGRAGSHAGKGWETFTHCLIERLAAQESGLVFMLWGNHAQKKAAHIDPSRHCLLTSVHPSPLSAHRGFIGCGHFSAANAYLQQQGKAVIDWAL